VVGLIDEWVNRSGIAIDPMAHRAHTQKPGDPRAVAFTVQTNDNLDFTGPFVRISNMLKHDNPGWLRVGYDQWAE
jgi:hypothetical protein